MAGLVDQRKVARAIVDLLEAIGENPNRAGLADTPDRVARAWAAFIEYEDDNLGTVFEAINTDQLVVVRNISVWSMCEHHLMPFHCRFAIGYLTRSKVLGLSKLPRIAVQAGHGLQLQERVTQDIWSGVAKLAGTDDVAVLGVGRHTCMEARGILAHGAETVTSNLGGAFRQEGPLRAEFMDLAAQTPPNGF